VSAAAESLSGAPVRPAPDAGETPPPALDVALPGAVTGDPVAVADALLKAPALLLEQGAAGEGLSRLARTLLITIAAGAAAFGAAIGLYRGGWQTLFAAVKLPTVVLLTAIVAASALMGVGAALGRAGKPAAQLVLVLVALARGCLVLAATSPVVLVAVCLHLDYHRTVLLTVGCCAVAGVTGLRPLVRALMAERRGRFSLMAALLIVVGVAGTHLTWVFRPYLVRPRETAVPFLRSLDGSFWDSVSDSTDSARGIYHRSQAPLDRSAP
jgi:hypothetical protein